jgi:GlpG protein
MIKVLTVPLSENLTEFAEFLWSREIPHRITEEEQSQTLWVPPNVRPEQILFVYEQWKQGADLSRIRVRKPAHQRLNPAAFPITMALLVISGVISLLFGFGENVQIMHWLTITDFQVQGRSLVYTTLFETVASLEWWRFISPIFMHFNISHLVFNALWIWVIGRQIEQLQGPKVFLWVVIWSGITSNIGQFLISGPMFGGLSGVVYAVLGYTWLWDKLSERPVFGFPPALIVFMVVWLLLGYTGVLQAFGFGAIANTAHLAGLIAGLAAVPLVRLLFRTP